MEDTLRRLNLAVALDHDDKEAVVIEDGYALYHTTIAQPHLRCELPVYEWCVHYDDNKVRIYLDYECIHKIDQSRFVAWVLDRKVGTVKCCNSWEW